MAQCGRRAILIVTRSVDGTTTNVVKERVELTCTELSGHTGHHRDGTKGETWSEEEDRPSVTIVRHEDEEGGG